MKYIAVLAIAVLAIATVNVSSELTKLEGEGKSEARITCPKNFVPFKEDCYAFRRTLTNFTNALVNCKALNAHLAIAVDAEQNKFLKDTARQLGVQYGAISWWLGGTDYGIEGKWIDLSALGECALTFTDWCVNEPNNYGGEDCLALRRQCDYKWEDRNCHYAGYGYICQLNK